MTVEYISPLLGTVKEGIYTIVANTSRTPLIDNTQIKLVSYQQYLHIMKSSFRYGTLRSGVLYLETEFDEPEEFIGAELNAFLLSRGASSSEALSLVKIFAANQTLIDDLVEKGFELDDINYGLDLKGRLKALNLVSRILTADTAFESKFTIYPLIVYEEELPPPPPEYVYRSQGTYTYSTRKQNTRVELRIWYQSNTPLNQLSELMSKWNEANDNAVNLTNERLIDRMLPEGGVIQPGFELDHEIDQDEVEGLLNTWYGKLIISRAGKPYEYDVL